MKSLNLNKSQFLRRAWSALKAIFRKADQDGLGNRAAALAFQALFSIVPILAIAYAAFALFGGLAAVRDKAEAFLISNLAPAAADQMQGYLREIQSKASPAAIGTFGVLGFLYSCVSMIAQTESALNEVWGVSVTRPAWKRFLFYALAVAIGPLLLGGSLAATSYLGGVLATQSFLSKPATVALAVAPALTSSLLFAVVYWKLPHIKVRFRSALIAGLVSGVAFELLKQAYALYAAYSLGESVYGSLAALPILFLWLSLAATIFLWGAEVCYFLEQRRAGVFHVATPDSRLSVPMLSDIVQALAIARAKGRGPSSLTEVVTALNWDQSDVLRHMTYLAKLGIITASGQRPGTDRDQRYLLVPPSVRSSMEIVVVAASDSHYESWSLKQGEVSPRSSDRTIGTPSDLAIL